MLTGLKTKAANTAKRAGLLSGGLLAVVVGLAFLTVAGWIYIATVADTLTAALVIGGVYTGLGLILMGVASSGGHDTAHPAHVAEPKSEEMANQPPLMAAFLHGMQAGVTATQNRR